MVELLTTYSLSEIIVFIILLAGAFRAISSFLDWAQARRRKTTLDEMKPEELEKEINKERLEREKQIQELEIRREQDTQELRQQIGGIATQVSNLTDKIDLLVESDKDDIKAWITERFHFFCERKQWIDDYSLDCIEKRYSHYVEEKGNSFIESLMVQLRNLPRKPPKN